jgi:hypothetical protein
MKSLNEFKSLVEEEKSDYSKFDMLVRAGLANKAQVQRIHRILDKMQEEKPVFNNADRLILQNLFNKMVDLISNNKQIFTQARRVVKEEVEGDIVVSSDYKLSPTGRKVKAHRKVVEDIEELEEATPDLPDDPPFTLVLKRKQIRMFPNKMKVALYYNDKIDKYFTIPYGPEIDSTNLQAEETDYLEEAVMDQLHKIVSGQQAQRVKFGNGQSKTVDHYTASAITQVHKHLNDENKKKLADMVHKSPAHLAKAADFAFSKVK